jgi:hypothetical protein
MLELLEVVPMHGNVKFCGFSPRYGGSFFSCCLAATTFLCLTLLPSSVLSLTVLSSTVFADANCVPVGTDMPLESTLASAGFFANLRYSENSIHYQMDKLLERAQVRLKEASSQTQACPGRCSNPVLGIVFSSTPNVEYAKYSEHGKCEVLYKQTNEHPIVYGNRRFDSKQDAEDWYNDLTQGDGDDGEDLYRICSGRCSPRYSSFIASQGGQLTITTSIICGHARDKDDDQYKLSSALRWQCLPEK